MAQYARAAVHAPHRSGWDGCQPKPSYLKDVRHFSLADVGYFAWIPFLPPDLGSLAGAASSWLIRRGYPLSRAQDIAMLASALLMPAALFVSRAAHAAATARSGINRVVRTR